MREIERDILLASSGELGPFKRARLGRRLARDPEARRLAETLGVAAVVLGPPPAGRRWRNTMGLLAAGSVATAAIGFAFVLHGALSGRPTGNPPLKRASAPAPLSETTGWLLVAGPSFTISSGLDAAADAGLEAPPLPPWSAGHNIAAIDLITERSR